MQFAQFVDHDLTFTPMNQAVNLNTGQANCISSVRSLPGQLKLGNSLDQIMQVLVATSMETLDNTITQEVTNHLFEDSHTPFSGLDLAILNLQRGRDHGL
ncbi:chorion peroxidase-like isoform X3 [Tachypleus tridentatus]|uniref:chorion peroxidase-like isoform X3 n=1 Tax=Tachypleus tridentatus TaxID=6853 RepID=UPI003FD316C7